MPSFPSTQPLPPEAAPKGCGCVSSNNHTHKNTGLPSTSAAGKNISRVRQITGNPVFKPFFIRLFIFYICHQHHTLHMAGEIDSTYIEILVKKIASSIAMAKKNLKEANVKVGKGEEQNLVFNRRYVMKDGSVKTNPGKLNPDIIRPAGPVDPDILVILLEDDIKNPIALLINYANHVDTIGGTGISADYPGILSRTLKRFLGDIPVLFLTGAEGDINHINVMDSNPQAGYEEAKRIGITLAGEVLKILVKLSLINGRLGIKSSFLNTPSA